MRTPVGIRQEAKMQASVEPSALSTLDVVKAAYRAFASGDIPSLVALLDEDVVWGQPDNPHIPSAGTRSGIDGVLEWARIGHATEDVQLVEPRRFAVDGDTVAVIGFMRVVARPTGRSYEMDFVHVVTVRAGRIVRFQEFFDTWAAAEAFRA